MIKWIRILLYLLLAVKFFLWYTGLTFHAPYDCGLDLILYVTAEILLLRNLRGTFHRSWKNEGLALIILDYSLIFMFVSWLSIFGIVFVFLICFPFMVIMIVSLVRWRVVWRMKSLFIRILAVSLLSFLFQFLFCCRLFLGWMAE